jgi:hypothetical protein
MSTKITTSNDVLRARSKQITLTDTGSVYANQSGSEFNIATDAKVISLPLISAENLGMEFTFRNSGADGNNIITISPDAVDAVVGTIANAAADSVSGGVAGKDIINTKATANLGDFIKLTALSTTKWVISAGVGIWASEA